MKISRHVKQRLLLFLILLCVFFIHNTFGAASDIFPRFETIQPNVEFWEKVYGKYTTQNAIIHDSEHLDIIYEVIPLEPIQKRGARRRNIRKIRTVKKKYKTILNSIIRSGKATTSTERRVFGLFQNKENLWQTLQTATTNIRFQRGQRDRFIRGVQRSGAYLKQIKAIFTANGLPEDLAYLPHVESSFNYKAYSKFGAAGIWQFTRSTGKQYMRVNYAVDERRDPIRASYAAAKYLKKSYAIFNDWALAITSYNHGVNGLKRAQKQFKTYEKIYKEYEGRIFGFASKNFYAEFLAAAEVAKNYKKYFGELTLHPPTKTQAVLLPGFAAFSSLSQYLGVSQNELKKLNPALRSPIHNDQKYVPKGYRLRIPGDSKVLALAKQMPMSLFHKKQKRSRFYQVQRGDNAGMIAKRNGITLSDLIIANNLSRRATIYAGQTLRIPTDVEKEIYKAQQITAAKKRNQEIKKKITIAENSKDIPTHFKGVSELIKAINPALVTENLLVNRTISQNGKVVGFIKVQGSETLGHYAEWLNVSTQTIRRLNRIRFGQGIRISQTLRIPLNKVEKNRFEEKRYEHHKEIIEDFLEAYSVENAWVYKVRKGENIWTLCKSEFEIPFWLVKKYNRHLNFNDLRPRQKVYVPIVKKSSAS